MSTPALAGTPAEAPRGRTSWIRQPNRSAHWLRRFLAGFCLLVFLGLLLITVLLPRFSGGESLAVLRGSMRPLLQPGDLIVIRPVSEDQIGIGSVVSYQLRSGESELVTHRVAGVVLSAQGERRFITQGDANEKADPLPVRPVQIRGELWYSVPWLGYLSSALNPWKPTLLTIAVAGLAGYAIVMLGGALRDVLGTRGWTRGPGRQRPRGQVLMVLLLATGLFGSWSGAPAAQAVSSSSERLELSQDGRVWRSDLRAAVLPTGQKLIPGEQVKGDFWVRNTSADVADLLVAVSAETWHPQMASGEILVTLSTRQSTQLLTDSGRFVLPLAAGAAEHIVLTVRLREEAGPETSSLSVPLRLDLLLRQPLPEPTAGPGAAGNPELAMTGPAGGIWLLAAGMLLVTGGLLTGARKNVMGDGVRSSQTIRRRGPS